MNRLRLDLPPVLVVVADFRAEADLALPAFSGPALHGALGHALKRAVCVEPEREQCGGCPMETRCAYPGLFDTPAPPSGSLADVGIRDQAPRPLVLSPEAGTGKGGQNVRAGEVVSARFSLIGNAVTSLPILVEALRGIAFLGLPPRAAAERSVSLDVVRSLRGNRVVYDRSGGYAGPPPLSIASAGDVPLDDDASIEIMTPMRLKHKGSLSSSVTPSLFFDTLARRANALAVLFGSGRPAVDEAAVRETAAALQVVHSDIRRVHAPRFSARQGRRMDWPGLVGNLHWRGPGLRALAPLLRFGEKVQLGKGTAFGFGRYAVVSERRGD